MAVPVTTYVDNAQTPAQPSTVGFKLSKPGYDANTAGGANMIFNSSWPSLPIVIEVTLANVITSSTSSMMVIPHNLGFPPFAMCWAYGPDPNGASVGNVGYRFIPYSDTKNVYITATMSGNPFYKPYSASKIRILIYALDLSTDIDYTLAPGATFNLPYDRNYGVKVVKPGKMITSTDMRDFSIHSRCQSPLIRAVKTEKTIASANVTSSTSTIQFTNSLKTPVWVYGFVKSGASLAGNQGVPAGTYFPAPYYSQSYPRTFTDGVTSYLGFTNSGSNADSGATLVILRDPMFAPNQVTIQY